jgi:hypothetical protein
VEPEPACAVDGVQPFWGVSPVGRGILLWLLGVPIPIIIILALLFH